MPTYEYSCGDCGERLEIVQSIHEDSLTVCPNCGAAGLRKVFGNVGVVFKGSGFYRTDSRKDSKPSTTPAKSEPAAAAPSGTSSTGGSDAGKSASSTAGGTSAA